MRVEKSLSASLSQSGLPILISEFWILSLIFNVFLFFMVNCLWFAFPEF